MFRGIASALMVLAAFALAGCDPDPQNNASPKIEATGVIGLSTSLPIFWPEAADLSGMLESSGQEHWALNVLKQRGDVRPLDTLDADNGEMPLPEDALLVLVQPYPFSPQEYVALDNWVREGGRVLLFADPMLTFESGYSIGDRRRPQDIVKLDPILARWGLSLQPAAGGLPGERQIASGTVAIPVNLPGRFVPAEQSACSVQAGGLIAYCTIDKGRILAVADAALFDSHGESAGDSHSKVLLQLLQQLTQET